MSPAGDQRPSCSRRTNTQHASPRPIRQFTGLGSGIGGRSTFGLDHRFTVGSMHLRDTTWLVLTLMSATLAGCNNFTATNQTIAESDSVAQSGPVVQSGAIAQSAPIAQPEPPSPPIAQSRPIAQSGAVVQSRPIIKSEAVSAYIEHSMQQ